MRGRIELLPGGPQWNFLSLEQNCPTKSPIRLFYRDPLQCISTLLRNPLHSDHLEFVPYKLYTNEFKTERVYTEWMSGDAAWCLKVCVFITIKAHMYNYIS